MRRFFLLALALLALTTAPAAAYDGFSYTHGLWAWSYASAYGRLPYRTGNLPTPPYFALHPPVYYSGVIVRRSYGDSPFAYGPERTLKVVVMPTATAATRPEPKLIENPYYTAEDVPAPAPMPETAPEAAPIPAPEGAPAGEPAAAIRGVIHNPFYTAALARE